MAQRAQLDAPAPDAILPAAQATHTEAAVVEEYEPAKQDTQVMDADAPIELDAVSAAHSLQLETPVDA